jgi:hypothetical protein
VRAAARLTGRAGQAAAGSLGAARHDHLVRAGHLLVDQHRDDDIAAAVGLGLLDQRAGLGIAPADRNLLADQGAAGGRIQGLEGGQRHPEREAGAAHDARVGLAMSALCRLLTGNFVNSADHVCPGSCL